MCFSGKRLFNTFPDPKPGLTYFFFSSPPPPCLSHMLHTSGFFSQSVSPESVVSPPQVSPFQAISLFTCLIQPCSVLPFWHHVQKSKSETSMSQSTWELQLEGKSHSCCPRLKCAQFNTSADKVLIEFNREVLYSSDMLNIDLFFNCLSLDLICVDFHRNGRKHTLQK